MEQVAVTIPYRPMPVDMPAFLPYACSQLQAPFRLRIVLETLDDYVSRLDEKTKKTKKDKPNMQLQNSATQYSTDKEESAPAVAVDYGDQDEVIIRTYCDPTGRPIELVFYRCTQVPRLLMKIIGLCIPYQLQLNKITIRWGPLDGVALYEIAKFLPHSQITEICLDDSPVPQHNYYLLLEHATQLKSLSLARCDLIDEDCILMASKLVYPLPASRTLAVLSLESNIISDIGARAFGEALRTNRTLRHLNLAGNHITNVGITYIFCSLKQFRISHDELMLKRRRMFEYLKVKEEIFRKCYRELTAAPDQLQDFNRVRRKTIGGRRDTISRSRKSSTTTIASLKGSTADTLATKAESMANELLGPCCDPFESKELISYENSIYCVGNLSLCYLNVAYNNLDCTNVSQLVEVLSYQAGVAPKSGPGLMRVVLEGNVLPTSCDSARFASELLDRTVVDLPPIIKPGRRSERAKFKA